MEEDQEEIPTTSVSKVCRRKKISSIFKNVDEDIIILGVLFVQCKTQTRTPHTHR